MTTFEDTIHNPRVVAVYSTLKIMVFMRQHMGIEAVHEFVDNYIASIERVNPAIAGQVNDVLVGKAAEHLFEMVRSSCRKGGAGNK